MTAIGVDLGKLGAEIVLDRMHRIARNEQNRCAEHPPGMQCKTVTRHRKQSGLEPIDSLA